jgi:hypothetical protein
LIGGLALLPGAVAVCTAFFYLGQWPTENEFDQVFYGALLGVGFWIALSVSCLRGLANIESADAAAYDELAFRATSVRARLEAIGEAPNDPVDESVVEGRSGESAELTAELAGISELVVRLAAAGAGQATGGAAVANTRRVALCEARKLLGEVQQALEGKSAGSALRWSGGSGYISLWRQLHRAEEALLAAEMRESLFAEAVDDGARLVKTNVDGAEALLQELRALLGDPPERRERPQILADLDSPESRALLREIRFVLNSYRDDLYQRFVRIRNGMFATLVYVGLVSDGLLMLAILVVPRRLDDSVAAGMSYFLIGALVGLFAELYGASKGHRAAVHDYGLALVRLLTIPLLSGIAAVLGVVVTRLGGASSPSDIALEDILALREYPSGILVAAIFGLTPGLILERLRAQTNEYKEELVKSAAGTPGVTAGNSAS